MEQVIHRIFLLIFFSSDHGAELYTSNLHPSVACHLILLILQSLPLISSTLALYARPQTITVFLSFISSRDFSIEFAMYEGICKLVLMAFSMIVNSRSFFLSDSSKKRGSFGMQCPPGPASGQCARKTKAL